MKSQFKAQLNSALRQLKPFLPQLIQEDWLSKPTTKQESGRWTCFNPNHQCGDSTPSCHFIPNTNNERCYCFGCCQSSDILTVNSWINGKPGTGPLWISENVQPLLSRFNITTKLVEPEADDLREIEGIYLLGDSAEVLASCGRFDLARARNLTEEFCRKVGIGTVPSWDEFKRTLKSKRSYSNVALFQHGIADDPSATQD